MYKDLKDEKSKISYCIGVNEALHLRQIPYQIDIEAFLAGLMTMLSDQDSDMPPEEYKKNMTRLQQIIREAEAAKNAGHPENIAAGNKFREEYAKQPGVVKTESGLLYEILREGDGRKPKATDGVKVHYEGTLIDGTLFDSSYKRDAPASFGLNQVIKGWTEGLTYVSVGGKIKLVIPPELAYGKADVGNTIPGDSTLVFTVELLDIL